MAGKLDGSKAIQSGTITTTQLATVLNDTISAGGGPKIQSLIYPGDDTAANTIGGQTIYIIGSGFDSNVAVYANGSAVPSVTYISASNVGFTTPALAAATYPLYVTNPDDGATAILVPGLQVSGEPTWVTGATLSEQDASSAWNVSLSATGDTPLTYSLAAGSSLPAGISLASNGAISGTLSSPPETNTTYNFTVNVSDAQNQDASRAFSITVSVGEGVLFANNVLLIHADGTNNQNNHTFLDSSNNNYTITRDGNATQGTFSPFSQTGWSNYFDGSGDYLTLSSTSLNLGANNFTIEAWVHTSSTSQQCIVGSIANGNGAGAWMFNLNYNSNKLRFYCRYGGGSALDYQADSGTFPTNKWVHIAVTRSDANLKMFIDGIQVGTTNTTLSTNSIDNATTTYFIGRTTDGASELTGYISNLRILKGTAVYTSNFTPPTSALTAVSNTSLLTCQSNRFIDNSTNTFAITRNGDVSVQAFSPFAPTDAYTTANVGGSGYFDGTGDYLQVANNSAYTLNGDFTIEGWFNGSNYGSTIVFFQLGEVGTNGIEMWVSSASASLRASVAGSTMISSGAMVPSQWTHFALVRNGTGSNNIKLYTNGVQQAQLTSNNTFNGTVNNGIRIGAEYPTATPWNGYLADVRIVKGTAVYTSAFTPPTAPLTAISGTQFLCNFTNAGIFDQTAKNVLETVGDAKVSTAQYKYGTGSIYIPSTSDSVKMPGVDLQGDFTIEGWAKPSIAGGEKFFILQGVNQTNGFLIALTTDEIRWRSNGQTDITAVISKANWYHFAITRSGSGSNNVKVFVDGTQVTQGTYTNTILASAGNLNIGPGGLLSGSFASYGYIDDLRITRGYARYTSNFTAPTSAFKDK